MAASRDGGALNAATAGGKKFGAPVLMLSAALLFASMGVCVKLASALYPTGEIVFWRGAIGMVVAAWVAHARGVSLRTHLPAMHFWRSLCGVISLSLWFYALAGLPLATALTLNYMSSVWMALFLLGGAVLLGASRVDARLVMAVLSGFAGVALVLRPTIAHEQLWYGGAGLLSGMIAALAYLQVTTLGRRGEPEARIVFYFAVGTVAAGALSILWTGFSAFSWRGSALLLAIGVMATAGQLMMTRAYAIGSTLANAGLQYAGIVFAAIYGLLLFGERLSWMALLGIFLIVLAGLASTLLARVPNAPPATAES